MILEITVDLLIMVLRSFRFHGISREASKLILLEASTFLTGPYVSSRRLSLLPRPAHPGRP